MSYKAEYDASYLLEPSTNTFTPFDKCKPLLDQNEHTMLFDTSKTELDHPQTASSSLSSTSLPPTTPAPSKNSQSEPQPDQEWLDEESDDEAALSFPSPFPGVLQPDQLPRDLIMSLKVIEGRTIRPFLMTSVADSSDRRKELFECVGALGPEVAKRAFFYVP